MEVVAGDLDALDVLGEAEPEGGARNVLQLEDVLVGDHLGERAVGRLLSRHRAGPHRFEATVDPQRAGSRPFGQPLVDQRRQLSWETGPASSNSIVGSKSTTTANGVRSSGSSSVIAPSTSAR